jgi:hypothetical protein
MRRMTLGVVLSAALFAGSIAGFNLTTAGGTPGREALAVDPSKAGEPELVVARDCPREVGRLWEEV